MTDTLLRGIGLGATSTVCRDRQETDGDARLLCGVLAFMEVDGTCWAGTNVDTASRQYRQYIITELSALSSIVISSIFDTVQYPSSAAHINITIA